MSPNYDYVLRRVQDLRSLIPHVEASGRLVGPPVFKTGERLIQSLAGSIPVRLRHACENLALSNLHWRALEANLIAIGANPVPMPEEIGIAPSASVEAPTVQAPAHKCLIDDVGGNCGTGVFRSLWSLDGCGSRCA